MFGYVRPLAAELKVSEYEKYRAAYCGLCSSIGRLSGQVSRLTLSYDLVFLGMVRMILDGEVPDFEERRCLAHPMRKRAVMKPSNGMEFAAAASAILAYAKNEDDRIDESGLRRLRSVVCAPFFKKIASAGGRILPEKCSDEVILRLGALAELEGKRCDSIDLTSSAFGDVLGYVFSLCYDGAKASLAREIGYNVGRVIYVIDAADDMVSDIKRGRYNALAEGWGTLALDGEKMSPLVRESVSVSLPIELEALAECMIELDPNHVFTPIVKNIVFYGFEESLRTVLDGKKRKNNSNNNSIVK